MYSFLDKINKLKNLRLSKFLSIGVITTILDLILYIVFLKVFHINEGIASALSFFISANFNFNLNNSYTFKNKTKTYVHKMFLFYLVASGGLLLSYGIVDTLTSRSLNFVIAKLMSIIIVVIYNYIFHSLITFK